MEFITTLPFGLAFAVLFCIVLGRSNATYWLGRGAAAGGRRTRLKRYLDSAPMARAEAIIARWGAPAVTACSVAVGLQTAVNLAAGVGRMPYLRRYLPAAIAGSILWALLYAVVGLAAVNATLAAVGGEPGALLIVLAVLLAVVIAMICGRRLAAARR
ncbi:DedA family protein [Psychromicrobium xiongbiense]|uniref:DedA family protein n=1 Tax=Psychromicrobium xiongbiense TaxID=3051184 RepID=UPI0025557666|nr:VTT domain-containing protein [Psychromicrobium sp. YIM S02556]